MAKVHLVTSEQLDWTQPTRDERLTEDMREKLDEGERGTEYRMREPGTDHSPQLVEIRYQPNSEIKLHSHDEDEIMYIVSGSMQLGSRTVGAGSSLFIAGGTFYGFRVGPEGLQILNFRPRADPSFNLPPPKADQTPA
jgi:mannose-6-phosphate isomerase-like protein (cupin superfamily)